MWREKSVALVLSEEIIFYNWSEKARLHII